MLFFCSLFFLPFCLADVPGQLQNVSINEINFYSPYNDYYLEISDGEKKNTKLENLHVLFFDKYGNRYASMDLSTITTSADYGLAVVNNTLADWPKNLMTSSIAALGLYHLNDHVIPMNVELNNPNHVLLDAIIYRANNTVPVVDVQVLRELMKGDPVLEPIDYNRCYHDEPYCDKSLSRCKTPRRDGTSFFPSPLTPGVPNECAQPYFVINEIRVNPLEHQGSKNEFVEITTIDPDQKISNKSLDKLILAGFRDSDFTEGHPVMVNPTFHVQLDALHLVNGYFTVGDKDYKCPDESKDCIKLKWNQTEFLPYGSFGLALLWGPVKFPITLDAVQLRTIDAIAYSTSKSSQFPIITANALNLADQNLLYMDSNTGQGVANEISFARQSCCNVSELSNFTYAKPTPSKSNEGSYLTDLGPADSLLIPHKQDLMQLRLNEVGLTVGREPVLESFNGPAGAEVSMDFVEVIGKPGLKLDGSVAVVYSGDQNTMNFSVLTTCDCKGMIISNNSLGVCPCPAKKSLNDSIATVIAVVLHLGTPKEFQDTNAYEGKSKMYADSVVFQTSTKTPSEGKDIIHDIFAPNQAFAIPSPKVHYLKKLSYSISRCFGDAGKNNNWLPSFAIAFNVTKGEKNICPRPELQITQIYSNHSGLEIELTADKIDEKIKLTAGEGLPLDQATLAVVQVNPNNQAVIVESVNLAGRYADQGCKMLIIGTDQIPFHFDTSKPSALVLYWDIRPPAVGDPAPVSGFIFSLVLSIDPNVPQPLHVFGHVAYEIDDSGLCSLSNCRGNFTYVEPHMGDCHQCPQCYKGKYSTLPAPSTTTVSTTSTVTPIPSIESQNTTLFINELYYDYKTGYSYVELTVNGLNIKELPIMGAQYRLFLFNDTNTDKNVSIQLPVLFNNLINVDLNKIMVVGLSDNPDFPNPQADFSQLNLVKDGPGVICLYFYYSYTSDNHLLQDCIVYTTNPSNTEGLDEFMYKFDNSSYAAVAKSDAPYLSISRCGLGRQTSGINFISSEPTIGSANKCPTWAADISVAIKGQKVNCNPVDGPKLNRAVFKQLIKQAEANCHCGISAVNLNFGNMSKELWTCRSDGSMEIASTFWTIDEKHRDIVQNALDNLASDQWKSIVDGEYGYGEIQYRKAYYKMEEFESTFDILLVTSIVVAAVAVLITLIAACCLCWNCCCGSRGHNNNNVIVPMHARRIDKSTTELYPAQEGLIGIRPTVATTQASQAHMVSAKRWSPPPREYEEALLINEPQEPTSSRL